MPGKISIIGTGGVSTALAGAMIKRGVEVTIGSRSPTAEKTLKFLRELPGTANCMTVEEATSWGDVIILAVPGCKNLEETQAVVATLGPGVVGKIILDATNPLTSYPQLNLIADGISSAGENFQTCLPNSYVYKAFNTMGTTQLGNPDGSRIPGYDASTGPLQMLYAGHPDKVEEAGAAISAVGFKPVYVGPIRYSRNLEYMAELWIHCSFLTTKWGDGFCFGAVGK